MTTTIINQYNPDYVSPPGETLEEVLEERGMSQVELAERMGRPKKTINEIIKGKAAITEETALQLELVLGIPAHFWNNRERHYRECLARQEEQKRLKSQIEWLKKIPVNELIKRGWISKFKPKIEQLREVLSFFGVVSPEQWEELWSKNLTVDFRKSEVYESDTVALAAWLRQGEIEANKINCESYNEKNFKLILQQIRQLTTSSPEVFLDKIVPLCAGVGVAVVIIPELFKISISGATQWLTPHKALLQLSLRYKTDDHFWFSFFHEAGHILLHSKREIFLELDKKQTDKKEKEADNFAADFLIPAKELDDFISKNKIIKHKQNENKISKEVIKIFAQSLEIAPGIVVGRLQKEEFLPYTHCNDLKQKIK
jgi:addiction module HigA family antidote